MIWLSDITPVPRTCTWQVILEIHPTLKDLVFESGKIKRLLNYQPKRIENSNKIIFKF